MSRRKPESLPLVRLAGTTVSRVALGGAGWAMTDAPWRGVSARPPIDEVAIAAVHTGLDSGITMIDTARAYTSLGHDGYSEALIARALSSHSAAPNVLVTTKGGHYRDGNSFPIDGRPETLRKHCELSLKFLGVDCIELYQLHCPDPHVPLRTSLETLDALRDEGLIRHIGVNSVDLRQVQEAMTVIEVASVQHRFGPARQRDRELFDYCAEHAIPFIAHSPLRPAAQGPLAGLSLRDAFPESYAVASEMGFSIHRLALAWILSLAPTAIVISGATRSDTIRDSALAAAMTLSADDIARLDFARGEAS